MPATPLPRPVVERLQKVYGPRADEGAALVEQAIAPVAERLAQAADADDAAPRWSEGDIVLITYADQLSSADATPLGALHRWLKRERLDGLLNTVHLLPFCPYTSDDGFSVVDYLAVDPDAGTWEDIAALGEDFQLMFDLVLNHCSQQNAWFQAYLRGEPPYDRFFIDASPDQDLSQVVRPRSLPLLSPYQTAGGEKHVWTTFSADQVDLNYGEPAVLAEMLRVLLEYAARGARIVRLDAVAFLWKQIGTSCLHLPQTHEIVKLCRDLLEAASPRTLVLTETNVPHAENVSYFGQVDPADGQGDEAHMVYNFSLPPLLLDAFVNGDATAIRAWLSKLAPPPPGCTFFNFTASHDGVGVRPLEGLVSPQRFDKVIAAVKARGGKINTRRAADGTDTPYELNIAYVDAMAPDPGADGQVDDELHVRRFLASQAVMLALQGMPAVYFHSLVGTRNDYAGVEASGQNRRINRHKYNLPELDEHLSHPGSLQRLIYDGLCELLALRIAQPAFHPEAKQRVVDLANDRVLAFLRTAVDGAQRILTVVNFSPDEESFDVPQLDATLYNLQTGEPYPPGSQAQLPPGGFCFLAATD